MCPELWRFCGIFTKALGASKFQVPWNRIGLKMSVDYHPDTTCAMVCHGMLQVGFVVIMTGIACWSYMTLCCVLVFHMWNSGSIFAFCQCWTPISGKSRSRPPRKANRFWQERKVMVNGCELWATSMSHPAALVKGWSSFFNASSLRSAQNLWNSKGYETVARCIAVPAKQTAVICAFATSCCVVMLCLKRMEFPNFARRRSAQRLPPGHLDLYSDHGYVGSPHIELNQMADRVWNVEFVWRYILHSLNIDETSAKVLYLGQAGKQLFNSRPCETQHCLYCTRSV